MTFLLSRKLCLVPPGITPSSRRYYEALAAGCVPVLVADAFTPAFASPSAASHLPPLERYAVRHPEGQLATLPAAVAAALRRWPELSAAVRAVRHAFIYSLGTLPTPRCDVLQVVLEELQHMAPSGLSAW